MGKQDLKKFLRYLFLTTVVLLFLPLTGRRYQSHRSQDSFKGAPLRCALMLGDFDKLPKGFLTGFNYELLKVFGQTHTDSTVIFLGDKEASYSDSLRSDNLELLVIPAERLEDSKGLTVLHLSDSSVAWVIKQDPYKGHEIIRWFNSYKVTDEYSSLERRFFRGYNPYRTAKRDASIISPYDAIIKKNAKSIGWDWRLLASMIWNESMFRIQARSPTGALGLMQMMPRTAGRFGVDDMLDPEKNIAAGAQYISLLQKTFSDYSSDPETVMILAIAAYNCGEGRTMEDLEGREQSAETTAYVRSVLNLYDYFRGEEPRYPLLSPDSLSRVDPGNEHAWDQKKEHDDEEGQDVGGQDGGKVEVDGNEGHEIILRI